jgi:hypothetical protein
VTMSRGERRQAAGSGRGRRYFIMISERAAVSRQPHASYGSLLNLGEVTGKRQYRKGEKEFRRGESKPIQWMNTTYPNRSMKSHAHSPHFFYFRSTLFLSLRYSPLMLTHEIKHLSTHSLPSPSSCMAHLPLPSSPTSIPLLRHLPAFPPRNHPEGSQAIAPLHLAATLRP